MMNSFLHELEKFKHQLPFFDLINSNIILSDYIRREWKEKKNEKEFNFLDLESVKKLMAIKGCVNSFRQPIKEKEDRIEVANILAQNMIFNLNKFNSQPILDILVNNFLECTEVQVDLIRLGFWAKCSHEVNNNFEIDVEKLVDNYMLVKGRADMLLREYFFESKPAKVQDKGQPKGKDYKEYGWFIVGLEFAKGTIQKLNKEGKSGADIARELLGNINQRPFITETLGNTTKSNKNIYNDLNKMLRIYDYCKGANIGVCSDFISNLNRLNSIKGNN